MKATNSQTIKQRYEPWYFESESTITNECVPPWLLSSLLLHLCTSYVADLYPDYKIRLGGTAMSILAITLIFQIQRQNITKNSFCIFYSSLLQWVCKLPYLSTNTWFFLRKCRHHVSQFQCAHIAPSRNIRVAFKETVCLCVLGGPAHQENECLCCNWIPHCLHITHISNRRSTLPGKSIHALQKATERRGARWEQKGRTDRKWIVCVWM